jgi:hypothetical protein
MLPPGPTLNLSGLFGLKYHPFLESQLSTSHKLVVVDPDPVIWLLTVEYWTVDDSSPASDGTGGVCVPPLPSNEPVATYIPTLCIPAAAICASGLNRISLTDIILVEQFVTWNKSPDEPSAALENDIENTLVIA